MPSPDNSTSSERAFEWLMQRQLHLDRDRHQWRRRKRLRRLRPSASVTTLMLGTASAALGLLVFVVTVVGFLTASGSKWHQPRGIEGGGTIYVPSPYTVGLGLVAIAFGVLGVILSWRLGKRYWTSLCGVVLVLLAL
jgi:hypothetical protein